MGIISHPHADMILEWVTAIRDAKPVAANPLVVGQPNVDRWLGVIRQCAEAQLARLNAGLKSMGRRPPINVDKP